MALLFGTAVADETTTASPKVEVETSTAPVTPEKVAESTTKQENEEKPTTTVFKTSPTTIDPRVTDSTRPPQYKVCGTYECVKAADSILSKLDPTVSPCDDFYKFACGKFLRETKIPDDKTVVDTFSQVRDALQDQLNTVITSPVEESDIEPFKMVKRIYSACMNKGEILITRFQRN